MLIVNMGDEDMNTSRWMCECLVEAVARSVENQLGDLA
jgi:hypothetical protein